MNKQPWYHEATILFTGTRAFTQEELTKLLQRITRRDIVKGSIEVVAVEAEPGDPADLM